MEKKYLDEETYQKNNVKLKKWGKILLIIGIVIFVISCLLMLFGFINFGNIFNSIGKDNMNTGGIFGGLGVLAIGGFMNSIGFILILVGGLIMFLAHRREINAFVVQQNMPIAQEGIEKITPAVADAAGTIAQSISNSINNKEK